MSIGFDRDRDRRKQGLPNNKKLQGKYHETVMLKDIFCFAEHQLKGTFGLGYKLTLTENSDNAVLNKITEINNAKIKTNSIDWYVPHYTPSLEQGLILMNQIVMKTPTEHRYVKRSVFMEEVNKQKS